MVPFKSMVSNTDINTAVAHIELIVSFNIVSGFVGSCKVIVAETKMVHTSGLPYIVGLVLKPSISDRSYPK